MDLTKRSLSKDLIYLYFLDNMDIEKIVWKISSSILLRKKLSDGFKLIRKNT